MILLNMVWPAIYVHDELWRFWFLIFATILIETIAIRAIIKFSWQKSILASLIGNFVSGLIGSFVMMWAMIVWHLVADNFVPHATFDFINWVATYVLMCLGSVLIETLTIKLIFKETIKKLYIPLLIGNLLTYGFIAYSMATKTDKDSNETQRQEILYKAVPNNFFLLDSTNLDIYSAKVELSLDENNEILNQSYPLEIRFDKEKPEHFQFELRLVGEKYAGGINDGYKTIRLESLMDTVPVVLEQKNPDKEKGWTESIISDTIIFIRQTKIDE